MLFGKEPSKWEAIKGNATATEIYQQPETWRKTIAQINESREEIQALIANVTKHENHEIILSGAGTSAFIGNSLFPYLNQKTNYKVKSYATTDLVATPENYLSPDQWTLLVSFGRSGNSPESIGAVDVADEVCGDHVYHLFITCNQDGALSKAAKTRDRAYAVNLCPETHDQGFAMTSSYTNMMLAAMLCLNLSEWDNMVKEMEEIIMHASDFLHDGWNITEQIVKEFDFRRIVYLGSNVCKGVAQESALKMLELTAGNVCTMHDTPLGFRHGPKSIVDEQTLTIVYLSDDTYTGNYERDLIMEMRRQQNKNQIVVIASQSDPSIQSLGDYVFTFGNTKPHDNMFLAFEYILFAQLLALFKSASQNITPDDPCPSGEVNRVVKGVTLYPYQKHSS